MYPSALNKTKDLVYWSNQSAKRTVSPSLNDSQCLKPSCASFPYEDEDQCKSAQNTLQEVMPDYNSITADIPVQASKENLSQVVELIRNAFVDELNISFDSRKEVENLGENLKTGIPFPLKRG